MEVAESWNNRLKTMPLAFDIALGKLEPGKYDSRSLCSIPSAKQLPFGKRLFLSCRNPHMYTGLEHVDIGRTSDGPRVPFTSSTGR